MTDLVVGAAIVAHARVLAARRAHPASLAGRWELPGGKVHAGETPGEAAVREIREELGCTIAVEGELAGRSRIDDTLDLVVLRARLVAGEVVPTEHDMVRWLGPEDIDDVDWLPSDRPFLPDLRATLLAGERLDGGNVGGAVRIGSTVRRETGPWTPAVHALLAHLAGRGLDGIPAVVGTDETGREALTFLPGRIVDVDHDTATPEELADALRWLRRFHDAVADFRHRGPWRTTTRPQQDGELICHHDFAPYNVAFGGSPRAKVVGVFDWDMAGPGSRLEDLGFAAWNWVPLWRPSPPSDAARRLRWMADGYGDGVGPSEILAAVVPRIERSIRVITAGQEAGDPGLLNLARVGEPARTAAALDALQTRIPAIEKELHR